MVIHTTRFGEIEVQDDCLVTLNEGLLGFEQVTQFYVIPHAPESPFRWLQAAGRPELAFVVINPFEFFADYDFTVSEADADHLALQDHGQIAVLSVVTFQPDGITANLAGPIVINTATRAARQVVLADPRYSTRHSLKAATAA